MGLQDMAAHAMRGVVDRIRRNAIAYSICAICAVAVLVLATGAGVLALVPLVGAVYALLIVAGVFLSIIVLTMIWLQRSEPRPVRAMPVGAAATGDGSARATQFAQIAMIIEAVMLGYSMSRKR
jgi:uncharacterized membrane protein